MAPDTAPYRPAPFERGMNVFPPPPHGALPGPEIDPSAAPEEAPASPSPERPWPPQPAEDPAPPPAEIPAPAPDEMPAPPPVRTPAAPSPTAARAWLAAGIVGLLGSVGSSLAVAQVSGADRRFMDEATSSGMVEIVLGRIAQEKAAGEPARRFGQQMVDDHNKANEALKALAAAKGVQLPTGLTPEEKANAGRMKKVKGAAFDRQYLAKMVADHQKAVALFAQAASAATDPDVKAFAQATLPTMRSHLQMAKEAEAVPVSAPKRGTAARE